MTLETLTAETGAETLAPAELTRCACGEVSAPDGACLNVGACEVADAGATRGAARVTAKYAVPAAWNVRGGVD